MAPRPLPTKTPNRTDRLPRPAAADVVDHGDRSRVSDAGSASKVGDRTVVGGTSRVGEPFSTPAPPTRSTSRTAGHNSTLVFRALLLIAAAVALAFTVAAWIAPPDGSAGRDATSPDAPPPAVFVQPDR